MATYQPSSSFASTSHRSSYAPRPVAAPPSGALPQFVPPTQASNVPPGTLPPRTIVRVGEYEVKVDRFLSGFAHVYLATSATPIPVGSPHATTKHVLKRMAVPDTKGVQEVGKEVEVMKLVRNHPKIVNMIEASVAELPGGTNGSKGYEIYILMEWCEGGGIIDLMNTRLQNRLTETEILKIFSDTVEAVAHMHYQHPPLIHRDLKVENILLSPPQTFKLCDFGSTTKPLPKDKVPTAVEGLQALELEINTTTTLQYRAPELVDVWSRKGFDEKIDIWALGVFLYKLCYYTTPFEEHGPLAILSAQYKIPHYPAYSNSIKGLIGGLLQESAKARPNIYQVHEQVCRLRGTAVRLENKYAKLSRPPSTKPSANSGFASVMSSSPAAPSPSSPNLAETISPMRRGRPTKAGSAVSALAKNAEERTTLQSASPAPKNLGHEWDPVGITANGNKPSSSSDVNGFGDSFTSIGANGPSSGFGDSFQPTSPSAADLSPALTPSFSSTAFSEPVEAPSTKSPTSPSIGLKSPLLASAEAVLNDQSWRTRLVSSASARTLPSFSGPNMTGTISATTPAPVDDRERFESTYPDLDGLESFTSSGNKLHSGDAASLKQASSSVTDTLSATSPASSLASSRSPPSASDLAQLTGEADSGSPLARRPPTTSLRPSGSIRMQNRADLTSRSSQTVPRFANDQPLPGQKAMLNKPKEATNDMGRDPVALPGMARAGGPRPMSFSTGNSGSSVSSRRTPTTQTSTPLVAFPKTAPIDLLGDDEDNDDAFAPKPLSRPPAAASMTNAAVSPKPPSSNPSTATNRASVIGSSEFNFEASREKFRPVKPADSPSASRSTFSSQQNPSQRSEPVATASKPQTAAKDDFTNVEQRFPEVEAIGSTAPAATVKEEETWQKIEEKEDESSDDDEGEQVEDVTVRPRLSGPRMPNERNFSSQSFKKEEKKVEEAVEPVPDRVVSPTSGYPVLPPITRVESTSTDGGGDIDLAPALASIRKFAPVAPLKPNISKPDFDESERRDATSSSSSATRSGPHIVAPKPQSVSQQDQINNLVSRYEGLSTSSDPSNRKPLPPVPGGKPTTLRQTSASSGKGRPAFGAKKASQAAPAPKEEARPPHWSSKEASISDFSSRFPNAEGLHQHLTGETIPNQTTTTTTTPRPITPPRSYASPSPATSLSTPSSPAAFNGTTASGSNRPPPFKPVPPTSGPSTPQRSYALPPSQATTKPADGGEEEEERFAGVSNMKSRWESITREQSKNSRTSKGPGKVEKRKSWTVV
ncbi:BQ2448_6618 [Microbotryum intermedium]|uniref:non-specific serine/threonine protein kinase n=1 Tax=Microbotryum intermedium TaxID=269621 RepID=A0A238FSU6_9BASI|nr:BQ2448_6618 [Microbotryum intermedium]